nr:hypothetical protein [uncultured Dysosmobacter sp.]
MAADGSVTIDILGDDSKFSKTINGLKSVAGTALKGMATGAAAATAGVAALSKAALDSYAQYEQLVGGVETLFKDSGATVQQYAAEAYKTAGVSANTYMEQATAFSASLIQSLGGDTQAAAQYANQAIMDMSDNANKMGTDIQSIQMTYQSLMRGNYAMLDNLKLGYGGTKAELERLVSDAEKLTGQALDPSKFSDVITAIHAVQENLGITGTTALEAATTIEGSVNMAKAAWSNLLTGIADDNADFQTLVDNFVTSVETAANNILPRLQIIFTGIGQLIAALAPVIAQALPTLITNVLPGLVTAAGQMLTAFGGALMQNLPLLMTSATQLVMGFLTYLQTNLPLILSAGGQIIQMLGNGIMTALPQIMTAGASIIQTLISYFAESAPQMITGATALLQSLAAGISQSLSVISSSATEIVTGFLNFITENLPLILEGGIQILTTLAEGIINAIPQLLGQLPQVISAIIDFIVSELPQIIQTGVELLVNFAQGIISAIPQLVAQIPQIIVAIVTTIASNLPQILQSGVSIIQSLIQGILSLIGSVMGAIGEIASTIINKVMELPGQMLSIGGQIIQGLVNGIMSGVSSVVSAIGNVVSSAVNAAKNFLGIHSPSRVFRDQIGWMITQGMALGIKKGEQQVLTVADQLNNKLIAKEEELTKKLEDTGLDDATKEALNSQLSAVKEVRSEYENALSDIQNAQEGMADKLRDYGDLFTTVKDESGGSFIELGDLQADIDAINRYGDVLEQLKARGVSDSLLDEITSMSVDEATAYTEELLGMTDEQYTQYMALWEQKQQAAKQIATQFYRDEMDALGKEFVDKIPEELGEVKDEMRDIGVDGIQGMIDGMYSQSGFLYSAAASIVSQAISAMRAAADIHSPSKKAAELVGAPLAQGVGAGFEKAYPGVMNKLRTAFNESMAVTSARLQSAASSGSSSITREITNNNTTVDRVIRIEVTGDGDSEFVRWLRKKINTETDRVGASLA